MLLAAVVSASEEVGRTRSRKAKIRALTGVLARCPPDEVEIAVSFLSGVMPQGRIGLGYAAVSGAAPASAASEPTLELSKVGEAFTELKALSGKGSQTRRLEDFGALLARATGPEQRFLMRLVVGELRQGALEGIMADAIADAADLAPAKVRRAVMLCGALAPVARAALTEGEAGLGRFSLELLRPVQPMLAQTAEGTDEALARLGAAALEYKLDGARVQVHRRGEEVKVFTRKLHEVTGAVPEVVRAARALPVEEAILDGEVIALQDGGRPHPFQTTMRRFGRRLDVAQMQESLPLSVYFFDVLHWGGEDVLDRPAEERAEVIQAGVDEARRVPRLVPGTEDEAQVFLASSLAAGHEGVMAKSLSAPYEAGRRGAGWLKVKPVHTLDLVVLAAEQGSGRRKGWLSNLHLGARDEESGELVMLGKTFKGLTDALLQWQTKELRERAVEDDGWVVKVRPELVVEIAFDGLQESPQYPGGLALRFARVKRYRTDKTPEQADTFQTVKALFEAGRAG